MTVTYSKSIRLTSRPTSGAPSDVVVFYATPEISEARSVNYVEISEVRMPASILIWMGSPSRNFNMSAKFISRSVTEADLMWVYVNILKSWTVANTSGVGRNHTFQSLSGVAVRAATAQQGSVASSDIPATPPRTPTDAPATLAPTATTTVAKGVLFNNGTPQVVLLEGYGGQFRKVPCVITSLNFTYPADVDYIKNNFGVWVPMMQDVSISLKEAREIYGKSTGAIDKFSLSDFRAGSLEFW